MYVLQVHLGNGSMWFFTPIYASLKEDNRKVLRDDLKKKSFNMHELWMLAYDFNDIMCSNEKKGGAVVSLRRCQKFK